MIKILKIVILGFATMLICAGTFAQNTNPDNYPNKAIEIIVPFTAGGPADHIARYVAKAMSETWGVPVTVENKLGAGGTIGAAYAAKAKPDGYTLVELATGHSILPGVMKNIPYKMPDAFDGIIILSLGAKVIAVPKDSDVNSFDELIKKVKEDPTKYGSYGTSGIGSLAHLTMEQINMQIGTKFVHVPYKGGSAVLADLLGGRLSFGVLEVGSIAQQVKQGSLRVIAVTGTKRSTLFPDVPTVSEKINGLTALEWLAFAAPAGTSKAIKEKIYKVTVDALKQAEAKKIYTDTWGLELPFYTPTESDVWIKSQVEKWSELTGKLDIKLN